MRLNSSSPSGLWSTDTGEATPERQRTARESPAFATCNVPPIATATTAADPDESSSGALAMNASLVCTNAEARANPTSPAGLNWECATSVA